MTPASFLDWSAARLAAIESRLDALLPPAGASPQVLHEAMRHAVLDGGKRVRPLLALAAAEAVEGSVQAAELAACAVELIHAYSLVHDDLPCMDNDTLRRGKPTVWARYGEAQAMLVGDALQALAFETLAATAGLVPAASSVRMVAMLARAAGADGMVGGQALDLLAAGSRVLSPADLEAMHRRKTGALLQAAVLLGAECAGAPAPDERDALQTCAAALGLAFQVVDDILDVTADTATLGKTAGKDTHHDKPTYVSTLGLDAARTLAARLRDEAQAALAPFGERAQRLRELADLIVLRKH